MIHEFWNFLVSKDKYSSAKAKCDIAHHSRHKIKIELLLPIWKIYHRFLPSDSWSREGDGLEEDFLKAIAKILIELKTIQKTIHPILSLRYLVMHHCCPLLGHRRWRSPPLKNALDDGQTLVDFGLEAFLSAISRFYRSLFSSRIFLVFQDISNLPEFF